MEGFDINPQTRADDLEDRLIRVRGSHRKAFRSTATNACGKTYCWTNPESWNGSGPELR